MCNNIFKSHFFLVSLRLSQYLHRLTLDALFYYLPAKKERKKTCKTKIIKLTLISLLTAASGGKKFWFFFFCTSMSLQIDILVWWQQEK
jgi:hypothetical protein